MKGIFKRNNKYSYYAIIVISIIFIYQNCNVARWKSPKGVIQFDVISYYSYLPATFIYKDITLSFIKHWEDYKEKIWFRITPIGGKVIKMSMGLAMMYSPFFFIAHYVAPLLGYEANGYTTPYAFALISSCLFYLIIGLYFLRKLLLDFFEDKIVAATLLLICLSTNLYWYSTVEAPMSHGFSFSLFSIFLYLTYKWNQKQSFKISIYIGIVFGLITLIRPTNAVIILIFILWNISSLKDIKDRIKLFLKKYYLILLMIVLTLIVWVPQLLYWKAVSGQYLYYSYDDERFYWNNPHIINVLVGFRKGWLIYNPIMWFSIIGIIILWKTHRMFFNAIIIFFIINLYIISSWWCWWYGGGYSIRALIESYPIMAIPLAAFLTWLFKQRKLFKIPMFVLLTLFTLKGSYSIVQYYYETIHYDSMTKKAYFKYFFKIKPDADFYNLLEKPDYDNARENGKETNVIDEK